MRNTLFAAIMFLGTFSLATASANAEGLSKMGPPIPTTVVVTKPAPGEVYGNKPTVTMGVGDKAYKFILKDGTTNDLRVKWPDIWEYVSQFNPNFVVQGQGEDTFAKIQPGQTATVQGMFAPLDRTFEVMNVEPGSSANHY